MLLQQQQQQNSFTYRGLVCCTAILDLDAVCDSDLLLLVCDFLFAHHMTVYLTLTWICLSGSNLSI